MARRSKLSEAKWAEIEKRYLAGEKALHLAKEFKVPESTIRTRYSARNDQIKEVANQVIAAEIAFESLPVSAKVSAKSLIDQLRAISGHLASAAQYGAMTSNRLSQIAHSQATRLGDEVDGDQLRTVAALTATANEAAKTGLNLISANKDRMAAEPEAEQPTTQPLLPAADWRKAIDAARAKCSQRQTAPSSTP